MASPVSAKSHGALTRGVSLGLVALLTLGPGSGLARSSEPNPGPSGAIAVGSDPVGAAVYVDGQFHGQTPVSLDRVAAGDHRVRVVKDGYLENSRIVSVGPGASSSVQVKLTRNAVSEASPTVQVESGGGGGGGGATKWILIGAGVVGVGAAAFFLLNKNSPPRAGSVVAAPSIGLAAATRISLTAQGASDPDGDSLTFTWDFGDGSSGTGQSVSHVYNAGGPYSPKVTVSDGKKSAVASGSVNIKSLTGTWVGNLTPNTNDFFTWTLTQSGTTITGTYSDTVNGRGTVAGTIGPGDFQVTLRNSIPGFIVGVWTGNARSSDVDQVSGTTDWFVGGVRTFFVNRR